MNLLLDTTRILQADGLFGVLMRDIPNPIRLNPDTNKYSDAKRVLKYADDLIDIYIFDHKGYYHSTISVLGLEYKMEYTKRKMEHNLQAIFITSMLKIEKMLRNNFTDTSAISILLAITRAKIINKQTLIKTSYQNYDMDINSFLLCILDGKKCLLLPDVQLLDIDENLRLFITSRFDSLDR
jgi:hypothetical protein